LHEQTSQDTVVGDIADDLLSYYIEDVVYDLNDTTALSYQPYDISSSSFIFRSDWHDIYEAIVILDQDWHNAVDIIVPLFQRYHRLSKDLQNALQNLATLYEMRVVYDLVRILDESLAAISRIYRYTSAFPGWKKLHGLCERLAISIIYRVITQDAVFDNFGDQHRPTFELVLNITGLDRNVKFRTMLYNRMMNSWSAKDLNVNEIVLNAIAEADSIHLSTEQYPSSYYQIFDSVDFYLIDSACFQEL
ncbi:hypothetical protein BVRB_031880, partial [Beta vulgaris subsp. vulgaris]